jgi:hypothetical protein
MLDIHVPTHEPHLQTKECRIFAIVRENEFDGMAIGNSRKPLPKANVVALDNGPISREPFP